MDYEKLTPRELDALVAERIMGYAKSEIRKGGFFRPDPSASLNGVLNYFDFRPSADIAAAFEVVEKMRSSRPSQSDWLFLLRYQFGAYINGYLAESDFPARAICIAALRSIEKESEEK